MYADQISSTIASEGRPMITSRAVLKNKMRHLHNHRDRDHSPGRDESKSNQGGCGGLLTLSSGRIDRRSHIIRSRKKASKSTMDKKLGRHQHQHHSSKNISRSSSNCNFYQKVRRPIDVRLMQSFRDLNGGIEQERNVDFVDTDSMSITLSTVSCSSGESSCFNAGESKDSRTANDNDKKCSMRTSSVHIEFDAEGEGDDGYESDQAVCGGNRTTSASTKKSIQASIANQQRQRSKQKQPLVFRDDERLEQEVQQTVEQILHEQTIALEAWDEVASEYHHRIESFTSLFVPHLLDPKYLTSSKSASASVENNVYQHHHHHHHLAGKSVLDVAAGTGAAAMYAASHGASHVMATDFSANMLQVLQKLSRAASSSSSHHDCQTNKIETTVANGMCLPLNWTNTYDIVTSNFGVIYFPKVKEGLMEMVRCAKPGGKVCLSGWGSTAETHAFSVFPAAMKRCGLDRKWYRAQSASRKQMLALTSAGIIEQPSSAWSSSSSRSSSLSSSTSASASNDHRQRRSRPSLTPNFFCPAKRISSSQYYLRSIMVDAGLTSVQVIPVTNILKLDSIESYWERFVLASPNLKRFVDRCLSFDEVIVLKDAVADILKEENGGCGDGVALSSSAYIAVGTKRSARRRRTKDA